jgi:hypothetical protein
LSGEDGGRLVRHYVKAGRMRVLGDVDEWAKGYEVKVGAGEPRIVL